VIYEIGAKKNTRVSSFGPGCRIKKPAKSGFGKTSNCHNIFPRCQNWTYCVWFRGRKMRSTELVLQKNTRVSWFGPGCRIQKSAKSSFNKTSKCHNFCPVYQNWTYSIWFWGRKIRSPKLVLKEILESLDLVLLARYKHRPNLVLSKRQITITFALTIRIGHIVYGIGVGK